MKGSDYVLFLDDERHPPEGRDVFGWEVVHVRNLREFALAIRARGAPAMVCFDWYLGSGEPTGLDAVEWLVDHDLRHDVVRENLLFDSQSSDRDKARAIVRRLAEHIAAKFGNLDAEDVARAGRRGVPRKR